MTSNGGQGANLVSKVRRLREHLLESHSRLMLRWEISKIWNLMTASNKWGKCRKRLIDSKMIKCRWLANIIAWSTKWIEIRKHIQHRMMALIYCLRENLMRISVPMLLTRLRWCSSSSSKMKSWRKISKSTRLKLNFGRQSIIKLRLNSIAFSKRI
jgi:hypothetical protein